MVCACRAALPYDWTVEHVILWVRFVLRLPAYVSIVKHRQIDGAELINMTSAELNALAAFSPTDAEVGPRLCSGSSEALALQ